MGEQQATQNRMNINEFIKCNLSQSESFCNLDTQAFMFLTFIHILCQSFAQILSLRYYSQIVEIFSYQRES